MDLNRCPHCGAQVVPTADNACPSCRRSLESSALPVPNGNPYQSPNTIAHKVEEKPVDGKIPFSHQAAKFSLYAPLVIIFMGIFISSQQPANQSVSVVLGLLNILLMLSGLVLGFVGLVGGIRRRAFKTIFAALLGIVLNGVFTFLTFLAIWSLVQRA